MNAQAALRLLIEDVEREAWRLDVDAKAFPRNGENFRLRAAVLRASALSAAHALDTLTDSEQELVSGGAQ